MPRLTIFRGLPASGKTTQAKEMLTLDGNSVRVNKDDIRAMIHGDQAWSGKREKVTVKLQTALVEAALAQNKNVIIDDTNMNPRHVSRWQNLAREGGHKVEIIDVTTSVEECINRDLLRDKPVGRDVILNMAFVSGMLKQEKSFIIVDLDGTLADITDRRNAALTAGGGQTHWRTMFSPDLVILDKPREDVFNMVREARSQDLEIVLCSGRTDAVREVTEEWLRYYGKVFLGDPRFWSRLIMRPATDFRPDEELKASFLDNLLDASKCVRVIDDRPKVIRMWKEKGLEVIDVGDGVEF